MKFTQVPNEFNETFEGRFEVQVGGLTVSYTKFADDTAIMAQLLGLAFDKGLKINVRKTNSLLLQF